MIAIATISGVAVGNNEDHVYSKAEGKKRAIDDDGDATATEEEIPVAATDIPSKKRRRQDK